MISLVLNVSTIPDLRNLTNGFMMVILFYRKGKLFFVSSTTITSTLKTSTVCLTHQSPAAAAATSCQNPSSPPGSRAKMCGLGCRCVPGTLGVLCAPFCGTRKNAPCAPGCFCQPNCGTADPATPILRPCDLGATSGLPCICPVNCGTNGNCPPGCTCAPNCGQPGEQPCELNCIAPCAPGCNPSLSGNQPMDPCTSCTATPTNPLLPAVLANNIVTIPTCFGRKKKRAITESMMQADGLKISPSPPSLPDIER